MKWISDYQLFLFDMDGLLIDTEYLHYRAYQQMCRQFGVAMEWSFNHYCLQAHYSSEKLRDRLLQEYPKLVTEAPWEELYKVKQNKVVRLLKEEGTQLMEGVEPLLLALKEAGIAHAVVTHSNDALVEEVRAQHPLLDAIPNWMTRHDYLHAKPHPECYLRAIEKWSKPGERVIGFEDSPKGMRALLATGAQAVLVCRVPYPEIDEFVAQGAWHFESLKNVNPRRKEKSGKEEVLEELIVGNQRFVEGKLLHPNRSSERRGALLKEQSPFAVILCCSDSRVSPEIIFDQGIGDLFVVRVAGNVFGKIELESIVFAVGNLGVKLLLVLGHENCGAVRAVLDNTTETIPHIAEKIQPVVEACSTEGEEKLKTAIICNVENVVKQLKQTEELVPFIEDNQLVVKGGIYSFQSGKVDLLF